MIILIFFLFLMNMFNFVGFMFEILFFELFNRIENFYGVIMGFRLYFSCVFLCRRDSEEFNDRFNFDVFV